MPIPKLDAPVLIRGGAEAERLLPGYTRALRVFYAVMFLMAVACAGLYSSWALGRNPGRSSLSLAVGWLIGAMNGCCVAYVAYSLALMCFQALNTFRVLGRTTFAAAAHNRAMSRRAGRRIFAPGVLLGLLIVVAPLSAIGFWVGFSSVAGLLVLLGDSVVYGIWDAIRPPVALVLSASTPEVLDMIVAIRGKLPLLRIVTLLDTSRGDSSLARHYYKSDDFRTSNAADWQELVRSFARIVPLIVMDVRHLSEPVAWEIALTLEDEFFSKVIYILGDGGERDGLVPFRQQLAGLDRTLASKVTVATPTTVPAVLRLLLYPARSTPAEGIVRVPVKTLFESGDKGARTEPSSTLE